MRKFPAQRKACACAVLAAGLVIVAVTASSGALMTRALADAAIGRTTPGVTGLSISISDGRRAVRPGDRLTYVVRVSNGGSQDEPHLKVTQTLPDGLRFISASGRGRQLAGQVSWQAALPAGSTDTFTVEGIVTPTPPRLLRLATVACAEAAGGRRIMICAAHLDRLPAAAGLSSDASARSAGPRGGRSGIPPLYYAFFVLAVLAVLAACSLWMGARRTRGRPGPRRST
jgi:uncharacterized repeat protein (TIGR01451 family)